MTDRHEFAGRAPRPRCRYCGDIIGVYEPMVVADAGRARLTSLAAEPDLPAEARSFHRECHRAAHPTSISA
jgi:hypothetical protein